MKIIELSIENFKTYQDKKTFQFEDGFNLILARNGSGKSTIIDAIQLILLDKNPAQNLKSLCNWDSDKDFFNIELMFEYQGYLYELTYEYNDKSSPSTMRKMFRDKKLVTDKASPVVNELKNLFDVKLMESALFSRQRTNKFVEVTNSERRETLRKIRNIDYTDEVNSIIKPEIERLEKDIVDHEKDVYALENKEYETPEEKDLPFTEDETISFKEEIDKIQKEVSIYETVQDTINSTESDLISLKETCIQNEEQVKKLEQSIQTETNNLNKEYEELQSSVDIINAEINQYTEDMNKPFVEPDTTSYESIIQEYEQILNEELDLSSMINEYEAMIQEKQLELDTLIAENDAIIITRILPFDDSTLIELSSEHKELTKKISLVEKGFCSECGRPFEDADKQLSDLKNRLGEITKEMQEEEKAKKEYQKKLQDNESNKAKKNTYALDIKDAETSLQQVKDLKELNISSAKKDLEAKKERATEKIEITKATMEKDLSLAKERYEETKIQLQDKIENKKEYLVTKENDYAKHTEESKVRIQDMQEQVSSIQEKNVQVESSIKTKEEQLAKLYDTTKEGSIDTKKNQISSLTEKVKLYEEAVYHNYLVQEKIEKINEQKMIDGRNLKKLISKKSKLQKEKLDYESAQNFLLRDFPNFVISETIADLECDINEFIDNTYTKTLDIKLKSSKNSIALVVGKKKIDAKSALSGAEGQIVQLGFINSFNRKLDLKCIFLDEPDTSVDDENSSELYEVLGEMSGYYKQMFVITHKKVMAEYLDNTYNANVISL